MAGWRMGEYAGALAIAGVLAGCAAPQQAGDGAAAGPSAAGQGAVTAQDCVPRASLLADRIEHLQRELEPLGLRARVAGCLPPALRIEAWVVDGRQAQAVVRGPLADGQPVDLGLGPDRATAAPDGAVSPDVRFNRHWWHARLRAYGLQAVAGQVGVFKPAP